jgi:hypothetical protein
MPDPKQRCDAEGGAEKSVTAAATWTIIAASPAPTRLAISFPASVSLPTASPPLALGRKCLSRPRDMTRPGISSGHQSLRAAPTDRYGLTFRGVSNDT